MSKASFELLHKIDFACRRYEIDNRKAVKAIVLSEKAHEELREVFCEMRRLGSLGTTATRFFAQPDCLEKLFGKNVTVIDDDSMPDFRLIGEEQL